MVFSFWKNKKEEQKFPQAMIEEAKNHPNGWVYEIDPKFDPAGAIPPEGIKGAWKVDENGELTGEYKSNPNYKP